MSNWRASEAARVSADTVTGVRRVLAGEPGEAIAALEAIAHIQRQSFTNPWNADAIGWELRETDVARVYVLESDGALPGARPATIAYCACWLIFDELHINSLAVAPEARRQGHARRLLNGVFRDAVAGGATSATLEVRRSNDAALALYRGLGFEVAGVRANYYQQPREDALILWHRALHLLAGEAR
jgi:ribosomal-protein-alanine N-acetyltransferase